MGLASSPLDRVSAGRNVLAKPPALQHANRSQTEGPNKWRGRSYCSRQLSQRWAACRRRRRRARNESHHSCSPAGRSLIVALGARGTVRSAICRAPNAWGACRVCAQTAPSLRAPTGHSPLASRQPPAASHQPPVRADGQAASVWPPTGLTVCVWRAASLRAPRSEGAPSPTGRPKRRRLARQRQQGRPQMGRKGQTLAQSDERNQVSCQRDEASWASVLGQRAQLGQLGQLFCGT